jgi:hypothetical protein
LASSACAGSAVPANLKQALDHALTLIDRAATSTPKKTKKLKTRAKGVLEHAKGIAKRASKETRAKLSPGCATKIEAAATSVAAGL